MIVLNSGFEVAAGRRRQCARRPARWANLRNSSGFLRKKARIKGARRPAQRRTWAEMRRYRETNARFPAHSRCCLRDPGRSALRPIEVFKAKVRFVRNTSTPAIRRPVTKVIASLRRQPQRPNFLKETPKILFRRKAHGSICVQEGQPFVHAAKPPPLISSGQAKNSISGHEGEPVISAGWKRLSRSGGALSKARSSPSSGREAPRGESAGGRAGARFGGGPSTRLKNFVAPGTNSRLARFA